MPKQTRRFQIIDGRHYVDKVVAAEMLGINEQTLINYRRKPDPPPYNSDLMMYPVGEFCKWMRETYMFKTGKGGAPQFGDLFVRNGYVPKSVASPTLLPGMTDTSEDQDTRLKRLKADKMEIELQKITGELIPVDDVSIALSEMLSRVKMKILALPTSLSPLISGKQDPVEIQEIIDDNVRSALEELSSDWRAELNDEEEDE